MSFLLFSFAKRRFIPFIPLHPEIRYEVTICQARKGNIFPISNLLAAEQKEEERFRDD